MPSREASRPLPDGAKPENVLRRRRAFAALGPWSSGYDNALTRRRSPVQIRLGPLHVKARQLFSDFNLITFLSDSLLVREDEVECVGKAHKQVITIRTCENGDCPNEGEFDACLAEDCTT